MLSGLQGQDSPASPVSLELVPQWPWHHFSSFRNVESKNSLGPCRLSSSKQDQVQLMSVSTGPGAQHRTAVRRMQTVAGKDHVVCTPQVWVLLPGSAIYNLRSLFTSLNLNFTCCKNRSSLTVQFSRSVVSKSLRPHGLQHARPPCPSPTPEICTNSCPSSW